MSRHAQVRQITRRSHHAARITQAGVALAVLSALIACGGHTDPTMTEAPISNASTFRAPADTPASQRLPLRSNAVAAASASTVRASPRGVLLTDVSGSNAYAALSMCVLDSPASSQPATSAPHTTSLTALIDLSATVGQVNAALNAAGARIVAMRPGHTAIEIELADAVGTATLRDAAARLMASRAFQWVQGPELPAAPLALAVDPAASEPIDDHAPPP